MATTMLKPTAVAAFADYYNKLNIINASHLDIDTKVLINGLTANLYTALKAISDNDGHNIVFAEPRYTIVPYSNGIRPFKVRAGQAINLTVGKTGGETSSAAVWSAVNLPSWLTFSSGGVFSGTAPNITKSTFNILSGGSKLQVNEIVANVKISCQNAFGESTNGPIPLTFMVVNLNCSVVSSAATAAGVHGGAFTTYNITANNTPTAYVAYGLEQFGGTVVLNSSTGAITGTVAAGQTTGTYTIYVAAINANGEGEDKAVVVTIT